MKDAILVHWQTTLCGALALLGAGLCVKFGAMTTAQAAAFVPIALGLFASTDANKVPAVETKP